MKKSIFLIVVGCLFLIGFADLVMAGTTETVQKVSIWQTISGFFVLITGGVGLTLWKKIAILKDLRDAIQSMIQVPAAVQLFVHSAPANLKSDPNYINMMEKIDKATDEFADILAYNKKFQKQAEWLRSVINKDFYTKEKTINAEAIRKANEILASSEITNAFDKAIAQLSIK